MGESNQKKKRRTVIKSNINAYTTEMEKRLREKIVGEFVRKLKEIGNIMDVRMLS